MSKLSVSTSFFANFISISYFATFDLSFLYLVIKNALSGYLTSMDPGESFENVYPVSSEVISQPLAIPITTSVL